MRTQMYNCQTESGRKRLTEEDICLIAQPVINGVLRGCYARYSAEHDDLSQEVLIAVIAAMPKYDAERGTIEAFIHGIATRNVSKQVKKIIRRQSHEVELVEAIFAPSNEPAYEGNSQEEFERLITSFEKLLTKKERKALEMRLNGAGNTEIYNTLNPRKKKKYIGKAMVGFWKRIAEKYDKWRNNR